jgi:ubiquinone/menaquinone biosynthesis C-methylase UbiE
MSTPHHPLLARIYDVVMMPNERMGIRRQRGHLCRLATGTVLEVGVGTGLNLPHYERAKEVIAIDADPHWLRRAHKRAVEAIVPVTLMQANAEQLPFRDNTFHTVVIGLTLCTIRQPQAALAEARRVADEGGELHFLEHVRSPRSWVGKIEDVIAPVWGKVAGGCRPNQDTVRLIEDSGWEITKLWTASHGGLVQGTAIVR